jgi:3-deoxy-D-manno-octulosonic-acid transferase
MLFIIIYNFLLLILYPLIILNFFYRLHKGKISKKRALEKISISRIKRPSGDLIWFHCASVGEFNSIKSFLNIISKADNYNILLTSGTVTSASEIKKFQETHPKIIHQFIPIDGFFMARKFINFWKPNKIIFVESEIWPNLLFHAKKNNIKITLLNARISDTSFYRWNFIQKIGLNFFKFIDLCLPQSKRDFIKFKKLGVSEINNLGNLKSYFDPKLINIKKPQHDRLIWLSASTHKGEEEIAIKAHKEILKKYPKSLLIIAPRHPERFNNIAKMLEKENLDFNCYTNNKFNFGEKNFYLMDTLGKMNEVFLNFAKFAFIGGSMFPKIGGHNPFEALRNFCLPISGKYFSNFKESYLSLKKRNLCFIVNNQDELYKILLKIKDDQNLWKKFESSNLNFIQQQGDILNKIYNKIFNKRKIFEDQSSSQRLF